jgi:hypothetical protein
MHDPPCMISHHMYSHSMTNTQTPEQQRLIEKLAVKASLGWSGWGSPVGLGILLVCVGAFIICLHLAGIVHGATP